jgi:hypothetical protein
MGRSPNAEKRMEARELLMGRSSGKVRDEGALGLSPFGRN